MPTLRIGLQVGIDHQNMDKAIARILEKVCQERWMNLASDFRGTDIWFFHFVRRTGLMYFLISSKCIWRNPELITFR
jgi:hypothetical protein